MRSTSGSGYALLVSHTCTCYNITYNNCYNNTYYVLLCLINRRKPLGRVIIRDGISDIHII